MLNSFDEQLGKSIQKGENYQKMTQKIDECFNENQAKDKMHDNI